MVSMWTVAAAAYLGYATVFGTIEEQMYYILLLPSVISICAWSVGWQAERSRRWRTVVDRAAGPGPAGRRRGVGIVHFGHDDEYLRMVSWESRHVPVTAVVAATDGTSQFLLTRGSSDSGARWPS